MARKRGRSWQEQVRIKEKGVIVYSESATRETKQAATLWKLQRLDEIKKHGWRKVVVTTTTVEQLLRDYQTLKARTARPLGRGFEHSLGAVASSELGKLSLDALTSAKIVEFAVGLHESGQAPATVMHHMATLRAAINSAGPMFGTKVDAGQVTNAIKQLKQLAVAGPSTKRDNRVADEDLSEIIDVFRSQEAVIPMESIVRMAIALPRRREELLTMEWKNISADNATIKLMDTKDPRKYREETVPIPPAALAIMASLPRIDDRVLPYKPESVSARWQRAVRRVGKEHLRYHDLRHEGISRLFEQGLTIEEVALISGHTSWTTLRRYTHLRPQDVTAKLRNRNG
jgi:integrase